MMKRTRLDRITVRRTRTGGGRSGGTLPSIQMDSV